MRNQFVAGAPVKSPSNVLEFFFQLYFMNWHGEKMVQQNLKTSRQTEHRGLHEDNKNTFCDPKVGLKNYNFRVDILFYDSLK